MKNDNSKHILCDGGWSAKDCMLIKAFLFWNSNRKRWKHQLLVWFSASAPSLSEGSLSHVALSFSWLFPIYSWCFLLRLHPFCSHLLQNSWKIISTKEIFQHCDRNSELRRESTHSTEPCPLIANNNIIFIVMHWKKPYFTWCYLLQRFISCKCI